MYFDKGIFFSRTPRGSGIRESRHASLRNPLLVNKSGRTTTHCYCQSPNFAYRFKAARGTCSRKHATVPTHDRSNTSNITRVKINHLFDLFALVDAIKIVVRYRVKRQRR